MSIDKIIETYPELVKQSPNKDKLLDIVFKYLFENITTVREAAALTIGTLVEKEFDIIERVNSTLKENLLKAK